MGIYLTVDIGGTRIRAATFSRDSIQPIEHYHASTRVQEGTAFDHIVTFIESIWPEKDKVEAIAVALPGPLDPRTGTILLAPNIPEWKDFPLGPKLVSHFNVPVYVGNDANLAALGEWRYGAGRGHHNLVYLTVSTGVGGGVIINDQLLQGERGLGAELGHVTLQKDGPLCSCGQPGHLEAFASGTAIARYANEQMAAGVKSSLKPGPGLTAEEITRAAEQGDILASDALHRAGEYLGIAVANFLHIFNPSAVIFGGGVSRSGSLLFDPLEQTLRKRIFRSKYLDNLTVITAELGDDAGLMGALAWALHNQPN